MNSLRMIQKIKNPVTGLILFFCIPVCGQKLQDSLGMYHQDSLIISKNFKEGTVFNTLTVKVINPCNSEKERFDGPVTIISAVVKNKNYSDRFVYNYPDAQSGLINLKPDHIAVYPIRKHQAVFIPFTYCGNWDNDTKVSCIILYNRKKYLYHISYYCGEDGKCKVNENLDMTLKDLPLPLKSKVMKDLETQYHDSSDFY